MSQEPDEKPTEYCREREDALLKKFEELACTWSERFENYRAVGCTYELLSLIEQVRKERK